MSANEKNNNKIFTIAIIVISIAGIFYFGSKAIKENSEKNQNNPYKYDIENFTKTKDSLTSYSEIQKITINLSEPKAIAINKNDELFIAGKDSILCFNQAMELKTVIPVKQTIYCIDAADNGNLYLGFAENVEIYDALNKKFVKCEYLGKEAQITSITVGKEFFFIADAGNLIVWKYNLAGKKIGEIGRKNLDKDIPGFIIPSPFFDVAIDNEGYLWAANTGRHSLENYTLSGDFRSSWGKPSMKIEDFCGCCNPSHFAILKDGSFVTAEKGIPRVKIYNKHGSFITVVAGSEQFDEGTKGLDVAIDSKERIFVLDPSRKQVRVFTQKAN